MVGGGAVVRTRGTVNVNFDWWREEGTTVEGGTGVDALEDGLVVLPLGGAESARKRGIAPSTGGSSANLGRGGGSVDGLT